MFGSTRKLIVMQTNSLKWQIINCRLLGWLVSKVQLAGSFSFSFSITVHEIKDTVYLGNVFHHITAEIPRCSCSYNFLACCDKAGRILPVLLFC